MLLNTMYSGLLLMVFGLSFCIQSKHIISLLISLEAMMLSLLFFLLSSYFMSSMFLLLLTLAVCEAAMGLSLLVAFLRVTSSDFIKTFSLLYCMKFVKWFFYRDQ